MFLNASAPPLAVKSSVDVDSILDTVSIVFYLLTIVLGLTGNSVVIWVAGFKLKPKVTNVWLVNLAVADLVFCLSRVLSVVKKLFFHRWPFGLLLCKFNGFFKYTNMFCSVFLLAVISLDRALCVWWPVFTRRRRTVRAARVVAALVWAAAAAFSAPYFVYREVYLGKRNETKCSLKVKEAAAGDDTAKLALYSVRFLCGFLLPFMVILVCYILAGLGIRRTRLSGKSRPLRILALLVVAFFLCWAPYHCLLLAKMVNSKTQAVTISLTLAKGLAYFNSCVNPLLYFCMGLQGRGCLGQSLVGVFRRALAGDQDRGTSQSVERTLDDSSGSGAMRLSSAERVVRPRAGGTGQ
ncbi:C3a anaphylatoxin chemotactic receptor [Merluccius polli]|uniref:C3a anaphylatoxin chemotactic receptor n=1 Tax=Merluccius polli TaxID=89951 RepID=A0AA47MT71_MERPO|nr:C3a anaphylatoxin chemotactic receptor [Merluccius polli]